MKLKCYTDNKPIYKMTNILKLPLLAKVLIAIVLGVIFSMFTPICIVRVFETINSIFSNYLAFIIPLVILGLVAPSIIELGGKAGKLLITTSLIAYGSTVFSGLLAYFSTMYIYPSILNKTSLLSHNLDAKLNILPYFTVEMPPLMSVTSALVLAFVLGLSLASINNKSSQFTNILNELKDIVMVLINKSIIPLLPIYIFGIFLKLGAEGQVFTILGVFIKVIAVIFVLHIILLLIQFAIAGSIAKRNPFLSLKNMFKAYATALGTQSSAATIPITLECSKKNGVSNDIAEFVVPLCATIHLSGSILKIVACTLAIAWSTGMPIELNIYTAFIFTLAITMVAAPGVPGGAIMAAIALLGSHIGFNETQIGLMIALYIAMDSFGTAGNVTGDGAIAMVVDKINRR